MELKEEEDILDEEEALEYINSNIRDKQRNSKKNKRVTRLVPMAMSLDMFDNSP